MIVLKHPIAAYIILVTPANAEHFSFIGYERSAEFWNQEVIVEKNFVASALVDIVKVNVLGAPFEVMYIFPGTVALLQNKRIVKQFGKLGKHIDV